MRTGDGEATFDSAHGTLTIRSLTPRVVLVAFTGRDVGQ